MICWNVPVAIYRSSNSEKWDLNGKKIDDINLLRDSESHGETQVSYDLLMTRSLPMRIKEKRRL